MTGLDRAQLVQGRFHRLVVIEVLQVVHWQARDEVDREPAPQVAPRDDALVDLDDPARAAFVVDEGLRRMWRVK